MNPAYPRAFHAVASKGSFTTAARALNLTQPTLSSQVKALEGIYGNRFFDRVGGGVVLTELDARLHGITRRLYNLEREAEEIRSAARALSTGSIRVGSDGPHHVVPIVAELKRRYPQPDLPLDMGNADRVLKDLRESRIDLSLFLTPYRKAQQF